jgi:hypothetical protein
MGMKVAAVSALCQDDRVFRAMMDAGTPCPIDGKIGAEAREIWDQNPARQPKAENNDKLLSDRAKDVGIGAGFMGILMLLLHVF